MALKYFLLAGTTALALPALSQTLPASQTTAPALAGDASLSTVTVQAGRLEQRQFDTPGSAYVIDAQAIRAAGPQVNLSEALVAVPGVVSLNRNNYAQDLQISIRGFGARAAFGLRGLRLITDGIPASTPDGQGQASTVALPSTARIEVLTGPLAQIHGNASGGVIQTTTREAGPVPEGEVQASVGSYGLRRTDWQASARTGNVGIVADYSTLDIDGWRDNSAARRRHFNSVITVDTQPGTRVRLVANVFDMPLAQDPLGLTAAQLSNPSSAGTNAVARSTRKIVSQEQLGLVVEHRFSQALRLTGRVYAGERDNLQFQAGNTWVGLARRFDGVGLQLDGKARLGRDSGVDWVAGFDRERSGEQRQAGTAIAGEKTGVVDRNEWNQSGNRDFFAQANWRLGERFTLTTGARRSHVQLRSRDDYLADGRDGSGVVDYRATNPVLGLTWHAADTVNLYVNYGKGFETPTLAEAAYTVSGTAVVGAFNTRLAAARSRHLEAGVKWAPGAGTRLDVAVFRIDTEDEIVSALSSSGRTAFVNATSTVREGLELALRHAWSAHWRSVASASLINASYDTRFGTVNAGNQLPAVPARQIFGSLQWSQRGYAPAVKPATGWEGALDWVARSRMWANDANTASAPGYGLLNLRLRHRWQTGTTSVEAYGGIDNLADRRTIGSVIVNQASAQFYEPGLPRSWVAGVMVKAPF